MRDFLASWQLQTATYGGKNISLRVDGYDVDYEIGNTVNLAITVYAKLRAKIDKLAGDRIPKYLLTVTSANIKGIHDIAPHVDFINMQNYDGGRKFSPDNYVDAINLTLYLSQNPRPS